MARAITLHNITEQRCNTEHFYFLFKDKTLYSAHIILIRQNFIFCPYHTHIATAAKFKQKNIVFFGTQPIIFIYQENLTSINLIPNSLHFTLLKNQQKELTKKKKKNPHTTNIYSINQVMIHYMIQPKRQFILSEHLCCKLFSVKQTRYCRELLTDLKVGVTSCGTTA